MVLHHYQSSSGKDLILEYVKSLPDDEKTDGFSVLQCLQNNEMDKKIQTLGKEGLRSILL